MSKKDDQELTNYLLLAETLLRITALETVLIENKIITKESLSEVINKLSDQAAKNVLKQINVSGNIDEILSQASSSNKDKKIQN
jgi:hypothetical protein